MSYKIPGKERVYNRQIEINKKVIITQEEDKNDYINNNNNDQNLDDIIKAFEYFDTNHNGKINISELKKVLSTFGEIMSMDEINNIMRSANIDPNEEEIYYKEFINFWIGKN